MELDSFLATPRWDILQIITQKPSSPLEISNELGTTISFASQQLKLLEAAGLVKKKKTGEVEKGKPRSLFSISKEVAYIIPLTKDIKEKKLITLSTHKKILLKIWNLEDEALHIPLELFFRKIEKILEKILAIAISVNNITSKILIISSEKIPTQILNETRKQVTNCEIVLLEKKGVKSLEKFEPFTILYDPHSFFEKHSSERRLENNGNNK